MDRKKQNKAYKRKIYALCRSAAAGDKNAAAELAIEEKRDSRAIWARKHWLKCRKRRKRSNPSSIYATPRQSPRTEKEIKKQERIDSRGYHEGAKVAQSNLRRVDK